jgi:hypothetical protein
MNSQNARMTDCDSGDYQINHHIHFRIVDNKYVCVKNNVDPSYYCLDGKTLNFEISKSEYSEWVIENIDNNKIINSIDDVISNNPNLRPEKKIIRRPTTTTVTSTTTSSTTSTTNTKPTATVKPGHVIYWFYHAFTNKCLYAPSDINDKITVKPCDDTDYSKWTVLPSRKGYFYSIAKPNYCFRISNVDTCSLELGKCDGQAILEHTKDCFFELFGSTDKCIGFLDVSDMYNNEIKMNLNVCAKNDDEKFFNWDHNSTPVTVCFSEALGYPCCSDPNAVVVTTDESGVLKIINGVVYLALEPMSPHLLQRSILKLITCTTQKVIIVYTLLVS